MKYISNIPYVEYIIETVGWADIQLELFCRDFNHLTKIMKDLDAKFPDAIRKQDFWMSKEYHRLRMQPEMEFK